MKMTVLGIINIEGTAEQLSEYTTLLLESLQRLSDKQNEKHIQDEVNRLFRSAQNDSDN